MALSTPTEKYGAMITTVDPSTNLIEGILKTGKAVQIEMHNIPPAFRWPQVGESWMVRQENGLWYLDGAWPDVNAPNSLHDKDPGSFVITTPTSKVHVLGSPDGSTDFDIRKPLTPVLVIGESLPIDTMPLPRAAAVAETVVHTTEYYANPADLVLVMYVAKVYLPLDPDDGIQVGVITLTDYIPVYPAPSSYSTLYVGTSGNLSSTALSSGTTTIFVYANNVWYAMQSGAAATPPPPSGGDLNYHHVQGYPSSSWYINHGLGKYPSVTVMSSARDEIEGPITYLSSNVLRINFTAAFSGDAYLN